MKKLWVICLTALLLSGCGAEETMETIADDWVQPVYIRQRSLMAELPPDAAAPVSDSGGGEWYICKDYDIVKQTMAAGDLNATVRSLTGYEQEELTVMEREQENCTRYDFVWVSAGEAGDRMGRAVVLDDGNFHYCLSVMAEAETAAQYQGIWQSLFDSVYLN